MSKNPEKPVEPVQSGREVHPQGGRQRAVWNLKGGETL